MRLIGACLTEFWVLKRQDDCICVGLLARNNKIEEKNNKLVETLENENVGGGMGCGICEQQLKIIDSFALELLWI